MIFKYIRLNNTAIYVKSNTHILNNIYVNLLL